MTWIAKTATTVRLCVAALAVLTAGANPTLAQAFADMYHLRVCNEGETRMAFMVVRTKGAFGGVARSSWVQEGYYYLDAGKCQKLNWGFLQAIQSGYLNIWFLVDGKFVEARYKPRRTTEGSKDDEAMVVVEKSACLLKEGELKDLGADPFANQKCEVKSILCAWFGTHGTRRKFTIFASETNLNATWTEERDR